MKGGGLEIEKREVVYCMWGRVALQSLAKIAVTHCYTHSAVAFREPRLVLLMVRTLMYPATAPKSNLDVDNGKEAGVTTFGFSI